MILTTTPSVEGRSIAEYKGIVFGEVISGVDAVSYTHLSAPAYWQIQSSKVRSSR